LQPDDLKVEQMFTTDHTTTVKTVKIYAPFRLQANERMVIVNGKAINVAASAGRQQGDYLYTADVTLLREDAAVYTTAPCWASVEVE
jgi:hypothetical protein